MGQLTDLSECVVRVTDVAANSSVRMCHQGN